MKTQFSKISNLTSNKAEQLRRKWAKILDFNEEKQQVKITKYTTEKQFEYHKSCDWNITLVHGLEDKNGDIYILWDDTGKTKHGETITLKEFRKRYFIDAL